MKTSRLIGNLLFVSCFCVFDAAAQERGPFQPVGEVPPVGVAKFDSKNPKILLFRIPEMHYIKMVTVLEEKYPDGSPKTQGYSGRQLGKMVPLDLSLADIRFTTINGTSIETDAVLKKLSKPTHVFYGFAPEEYYSSIVAPDAIVIVAAEGKRLPQPKTNFHLD